MEDEVAVSVVPASGEVARALVASYFAELDRVLPGGFDPSRSVPAPPEELDPPDGRFLVASVAGRPVGCGGVRRIGDGVAEVKRMWVDPAFRGKGVGSRLLKALERVALGELGCELVRLDTSDHLRSAVGLYRAAGYAEVDAYNDNAYASLWFEKRLEVRKRAD
jgi:GNAT superfamily N-acetyltransferase